MRMANVRRQVSWCGFHHVSTSSCLFAGHVGVIAGEQDGHLRNGKPPCGESDDHEHEVPRVDPVVDDAVSLGLGSRGDLDVVMRLPRFLAHRCSTTQALPLQKAGQLGMFGVVVERTPGEFTQVLEPQALRRDGA